MHGHPVLAAERLLAGSFLVGQDYDGRWKALQYYVKDAFKPRLVSSVIENGQLCTYLVTDEYEGKADLLMKAVDSNGKVIWQKELTDIAVKGNTSEKLHSIDTAAILQGNNPARVIFYAQLRIDSKDMERNIFTLLLRKI